MGDLGSRQLPMWKLVVVVGVSQGVEEGGGRVEDSEAEEV